MDNLQQRCNKDSRPAGSRPFQALRRTLAYLSLLSCVSVAASGPLAAQGVKISALPDATSAGTGDMIPCVQGDTTRRCTPADFLALLAGGPGIGISSQTISTASNEADFLISGALTCGAATQGKVQTHSTTPLQYCDNAGTPTLRYAAYGNATGECLNAADNSVNTADIAADAVTEPKLKAVDVASDEECLTYETTTGDFEWQVCSADTDDQTASEVAYTPADGADWTNPDPDDVADGLDKLADRLAAEEVKADDDVPESGDFGALALTGPVTSSGVATSIANDAITEPMLKMVNSPTDELCLSYESTTGDFEWQACGSGVSDHGALTGLSDDDHTQYALLAGRTGGQTLIGGTGGADTLVLDGNAATSGTLIIAGSGALTSSGSATFTGSITSTLDGFLFTSSSDEKFTVVSSGLRLASDVPIVWYNNVDIGSGSAHIGLAPGTTGELKVTNGSTGSGDLLLDEEQELRFAEANANGANYLAFKAPAAITTTSACTLENDSSPIPDSCVGDGVDDGAGGGIGGTLGTTDNAATRADGTGGATAQGSALAIEDYVSTSPASDYVSVTPFGADSIISTRLNYVGGNGSPGVYGAGILINGTSVGIQASGSYLKTWDGGGGNASILIGNDIFFNGETSSFPRLRRNGATLEVVLADSSAFAPLNAGETKIDSVLRLVPRASVPVTCGDANTQGVIYNDTSVALCWCDGTAWQKLSGGGTCA